MIKTRQGYSSQIIKPSSPLEIVRLFGGEIGYLQALGGLEYEIYRAA